MSQEEEEELVEQEQQARVRVPRPWTRRCGASRLPEDILWRVLLFLPATTHFQLHLVSRKWRQVLTSADFRHRLVAVAAASKDPGPELPQRVAACVVPPVSSSSSSAISEVKVVNIELSSLLPDWFWKPHCAYLVLGAANGLVCLSNTSHKEPVYCVVNPLTRTFQVLPQLPFQPRVWLPPTTTAVTIYSDGAGKRKRWGKNFLMATYDLAAAGGGGGWAVTAHNPVLSRVRPRLNPVLALCGGETYYYDGRLHVLAPGPAGGLLEEAAVLDAPSVGTLNLYTRRESRCGYAAESAFLVAHRGAVFFVAHLAQRRNVVDYTDVVCGLWRLARDRLEWEVVATLHEANFKRLTGRSCFVDGMFEACAVNEFVCCSLDLGLGSLEFIRVVMGLNLDTAQWEQLHPDWCTAVPVAAFQPMQLRPDLFLA